MPFKLNRTDKDALFTSDPTWMPTTPDQAFTDRKELFQLEMTRLFQYNKRTTRPLLPAQQSALLWLQDHTEFIVFNTDKNLGPAIIERERYIQYAWKDHLCDTNTYKQLSKKEAYKKVTSIMNDIEFFTHKFKSSLEKHEITYINRLLQKTNYDNAYSYMYLLAKIHKHPMKTRAIISYSGSICNGVAKWIDKEMKKIIPHMRYVASDSTQVVKALTSRKWNTQSKLFTCDASSMYTNIHLGHALPIISDFLLTTPLGTKIIQDTGIRVNALLFALQLVMKNNIFKFGDTFWLQLTGTAMGTPPAPAWATLYFAILEYTLIPTFPEIENYFRYIDDGQGIWTPLYANDNERWDQFKTAFNNFGSDHPFFQQNHALSPLQWEFSNRATTSIFLDLTITINNGIISTTIYEKPQNLYLYIPPSSCHSPGILKSFIFGSVNRAHNLCTNASDRLPFLLKVLKRLQRRGHCPNTTVPLLISALQRKLHTPERQPQTNPSAPLFFHLPYNPLDIPASRIYNAFKRHILNPPDARPLCETPLHSATTATPDITMLQVAYHKHLNIGNILSPRKLRLGDFSIHDYITKNRPSAPTDWCTDSLHRS